MAGDEIKLIVWNVLGRGKIKSWPILVYNRLKKENSDIICLQEGYSNQKQIRTLENWGYNLITDIEFMDNHPFRDTLTASKFKIKKSGQLILPGHGSCLWAEIDCQGKELKIYNCHFNLSRVGPRERLENLQTIINDAETFKGAIIISGDMNTIFNSKNFVARFQCFTTYKMSKKSKIDQRDERYAFLELAEKYGYKEALPIKKNTWKIAAISPIKYPPLKLDWLLYKNIKTMEAKLKPRFISDHEAIVAKMEL
jgi:endonuclease/exonuclease/phosphatase family metal-dependent hydrolase